MSEKIRANAKRLNDGLERELRRLTVANHRRKVADATAFCEQLVRDGRATPALVKATLLTTLLSQDDTQPVHTFTENGRTVRVSAYEKKKRELGLLPKVVHFGERFPKGGPAATTDEGEAAKVRDWAGTLPEAALRAWGKAGPEQVVHEFAELRKKKPGLTARQFIGV